MLPRASRLTSEREVGLVQQRGLRRSGQFLSMKSLPGRNAVPRLTVVAGISLSKKATERNRAKRVVRALLAQRNMPTADYVITVRRLPSHQHWHQEFAKDIAQWFPA